jgi:3-oxoadipate enol-lactonase
MNITLPDYAFPFLCLVLAGASVFAQSPQPPPASPRRAVPSAKTGAATQAPQAQKQKPPPIERHSGRLDVGGSKIYYEECGSGAAVVLLHDGLLHSITWDSVWEPLCRKYHAIRYDRRGYGRSDLPKAKFSPTDDLTALLAHLQVSRAVIVGSSSGGALAIDFALAKPEMVEGLFLLGPVVHGLEVSPAFIERGTQNNAPLAGGDAKAAADNWSKDQFIIGEGHDPVRKKLYDALADNPQNLNYTGEVETRDGAPASTRLNEIHVPAIILVGERDISDVHAQAGAIEEGIAGTQKDVIINSGHLVQLEQPEILLEKLDAFVELQERKSVEVPVDTLKIYAGEYDSKEGLVSIGLDGARLTLKLPGQTAFPLFAESSSKFFLRVSETEIEFTKSGAGKVTRATIYQDGAATTVSRNEPSTAKH